MTVTVECPAENTRRGVPFADPGRWVRAAIASNLARGRATRIKAGAA